MNQKHYCSSTRTQANSLLDDASNVSLLAAIRELGQIGDSFVHSLRASVGVDSGVQRFVVVELHEVSLCAVVVGTPGRADFVDEVLLGLLALSGQHIERFLELLEGDLLHLGVLLDLGERQIQVRGRNQLVDQAAVLLKFHKLAVVAFVATCELGEDFLKLVRFHFWVGLILLILVDYY